MIVFVYFLLNSLGISSQPGRLILPEQVKVSEERFDKILSAVTKAKIDGLKTNADGREITLDNAESLLKDLGDGILDRREFKKKYSNIVDDVEAIVNKSPITRSQSKMVETLSLLKEIVDGFSYEKSDIAEQESNEQPDTINMPEQREKNLLQKKKD